MENVDILAKREASRGQTVTQHVEFRVEALVGDAVESKTVAEIPQNDINLVQRPFGNVFEVDALHHLLHKLGCHTFEPESQAHSLEFVLTIGAVHRRDTDGDMTFVIDVFPAFALLRIENYLFQLAHEGVNHAQRLAKILFFINLFKIVDILVWNKREIAQVGENIDTFKAVFLTQIGVKVADIHQTQVLAFV